jgi:hypothetical protein
MDENEGFIAQFFGFGFSGDGFGFEEGVVVGRGDDDDQVGGISCFDLAGNWSGCGRGCGGCNAMIMTRASERNFFMSSSSLYFTSAEFAGCIKL